VAGCNAAIITVFMFHEARRFRYFVAILAAPCAAWRTGLPVDEVKGLEMDLEHWTV